MLSERPIGRTEMSAPRESSPAAALGGVMSSRSSAAGLLGEMSAPRIPWVGILAVVLALVGVVNCLWLGLSQSLDAAGALQSFV